MRRASVAALFLVAVGASCQSVSSFEDTAGWATPEYGVVVTEHPLASEVGMRVLERGGNAADAAVAAAIALAVVYPQAGNLGGGGFAVWVPHEGPPQTYDFREAAPKGTRPELYLDEAGRLDPQRSIETPLAVGVPGTPSGLYNLHSRHGSQLISFAQLCSGGIRLASDGFEVDPWLARDLETESIRRRLEADPAARKLFYPDGIPLREGTTFVQPQLARTLRELARGPGSFYRGTIARQVVEALAAADARLGGVAGEGLMTLDDLASYRVVPREPLIGWFRGSEVIAMGPPSSGGVALLQMLSILEGLPLDAERRSTVAERQLGFDPGSGPEALSARGVHWWIEAMRRAFADRAVYLGDPDFVDVPVAQLLAPDWIAARRISIGPRADPDVAAWAPAPPPESAQTTHISVIDRAGNAVSLTTTLNASFGSGILVQEAGFLLNNELDDFSIQPGQPNMYGLIGSAANQLAGGKRPLSSMTPTVVREAGGRVSMVIGAPGGPRIITAVAQVVLRVLVYGQELEPAVRAPRLHQQWKPTFTRFEGGWDPDLLEVLANAHGHEPRIEPTGRFGSVQAIVVGSDGKPVGVSDPRRGGSVGTEGRGLSTPAHPSDAVQGVLQEVR